MPERLKPMKQLGINGLRGMIVGGIILVLLNSCFFDQPNLSSEKIQGNFLLWHSLSGGLTKIIDLGLQEFKQLNPDTNIVTEYIAPNEMNLRFNQQSKSGLGASAMILFSRDIPELVKAKHLKILQSTDIDLANYLPLTLNQIRYQGNIYGIPLGSDIQVLCYNQAKLQASQDPVLRQPPTELDGLMERSLKGYSVGMVSSFQDTFWGMGIFGSSLWNAQGMIDPQLEKWSEWLEWLKKASIQPNFVLNRNRTLLHHAFAQGTLTYYICNSSEIIDLKNTLQDDLRVALLPQKNQGFASPLLYTEVIVFNHSMSENEYRLGLALAKFLTNPEQQLQGIVQTQSFIPSNRHIIPNDKLLPIQSVLLKQSQTAIAIPLDDLDPLYPIIEQGELLYQKAISGEISSLEAEEQFSQFIKNSLSNHQEK